MAVQGLRKLFQLTADGRVSILELGKLLFVGGAHRQDDRDQLAWRLSN